jgi:hypothetical protein
MPLAEGENIVGRDPDVEVSLDATTVSRRHARITATQRHHAGIWAARTAFIASERLTAPSRLAGNDRIDSARSQSRSTRTGVRDDGNIRPGETHDLITLCQ